MYIVRKTCAIDRFASKHKSILFFSLNQIYQMKLYNSICNICSDGTNVHRRNFSPLISSFFMLNNRCRNSINTIRPCMDEHKNKATRHYSVFSLALSLSYVVEYCLKKKEFLCRCLMYFNPVEHHLGVVFLFVPCLTVCILVFYFSLSLFCL